MLVSLLRRLKFTRRDWLCLILLAAPLILTDAATQVELTTQVKGILQNANGGMGVTTAAANTVLKGTGTGYAFSTLSLTDLWAITGRKSRWSLIGRGSGNNGFGDSLTTVGTGGTANATSTVPNYVSTSTSNVSGNVASISGSTLWGAGRNIVADALSSIDSNTSVRWSYGTTDQTMATMGASDAPAGNWYQFRFSTNAGDTNWMCGSSKAGTSTFANSGVAADTNFHFFAIRVDDSVPSITYYIDTVQVCQITNTTFIPTAAVMAHYAILTTLTTAVKTYRETGRFVRADF
jgi:hypothetical protein